MGPEQAAVDPGRLARALVAANSYMTVATASADGAPWASPVWFGSRALEIFVWASSPHARHSRNIAENPRVSLVVFDSTQAPGAGSALYIDADAELASGASFEDALQLYNARSRERGLAQWDSTRLSEPAKHRLHRAVVRDVFVLDDHDERIRLPLREILQPAPDDAPPPVPGGERPQ